MSFDISHFTEKGQEEKRIKGKENKGERPKDSGLRRQAPGTRLLVHPVIL
jgi:hypothetical protein